MGFSSDVQRIQIARGVLVPAAGSGEMAPPGNAATITIGDSTANSNAAQGPAQATPFEKLVLMIDSSADSGASGVIVEGSTNNGSTWITMAAAVTYTTVSGPTTYTLAVTMPQWRIRYTNSAAVLTRWNMSLIGIIGDRA